MRNCTHEILAGGGSKLVKSNLQLKKIAFSKGGVV